MSLDQQKALLVRHSLHSESDVIRVNLGKMQQKCHNLDILNYC